MIKKLLSGIGIAALVFAGWTWLETKKENT